MSVSPPALPVARCLVAWFSAHRRQLPWRREPRDPYHVLVSELMLQQTRVERVQPLFAAFVDRFPDLPTLAAASEEEVLAAWSGLGYYRRARLLHRLARQVTDAGTGLPRHAAELRSLPGVGPYTAAAVASLAFGERAPVVDGNVIRVASRFLILAEDPRSAAGRRRVVAWVQTLLDEEDPAAVSEALMELGATVCLPRAARCDDCPLAPWCGARHSGRVEDYPPPRSARPVENLSWVAVCCTDDDGRWLLRRVDQGPILRGLWLPPFSRAPASGSPKICARRLLPIPTRPGGQVLPSVRHTITHRRIEVLPVALSAEEPSHLGDGWRWVDPWAPGVPTSSLLAKLVARVSSGIAREEK